MQKAPIFRYSIGEEIANSITHGVGALLSIAALSILLVLACLHGTGWHLSSYLVYSLSLVLLYTASTLYHALPFEKAKVFFKVCDHAAIYLLIAGTYTPFLLLNLRGQLGWWLFGIIWGLALAGVCFKLFFTGRFKLLSTLLYVGMGWVIIFAYGPLKANTAAWGINWLLIGGLTYTAGAAFYLLKRIPFAHAIWHLFVLAGSVFHFFAVLYSGNF